MVKQGERQTAHIFDGHVYIFRAYYSLPEMEAPDGTPTAAAYGFANTLLKYIAEFSPSHAACCFDHSMTSFRNALFPGYKASRLEAPPDLEPQFEICIEVARALGFASFSVPDFEADDLIATATEQAVADGGAVRVVSSDKDLSQLVTEDGRVTLYDLGKDREFDADGVREKFGVSPEQIPDYLALVGDSVDELPGVPGVGPKSAAAALASFGHLEAFPESINEWEAVATRGARRLGERVNAHREQTRKVRDLATVVRDVPALGKLRLADLVYRGADQQAVEALFERLGWGRIATRVQHFAPRD